MFPHSLTNLRASPLPSRLSSRKECSLRRAAASQPHLSRGRGAKPAGLQSFDGIAPSAALAPSKSMASGVLTAPVSTLATTDDVWEDLCRTLREL